VKVLILGGGGREHALAWKISQSPLVKEVHAAPGNPGIASLATCHSCPSENPQDYLALAKSLRIDLTVVGPEAPLVAGIVDTFRAAGMPIVGPTAAAAQLEGSKAFSKAFMHRAGIPTAKFTVVASQSDALAAISDFDYPVVLKADGLAAGKGVVIAQNQAAAENAIAAILSGEIAGQAGGRIVIEEFLAGEEISFIVLSDGKSFVAMEPSQDHKAIYDGDKGPNTGGMGAYCASGILTPDQTELIIATVIAPSIRQMAAEGTPFTGFLYAGLMMTAAGPKVLEFNARLGDPETQAILHRMESDFVPALLASATGTLSNHTLRWRVEPSVCVVMAASGYPGKVHTGDPIAGIERDECVFQAGTKIVSGHLVTSGGRVLGVTARGANLQQAIDNAYHDVKNISFAGMQFRKDIGQKGLNRC
jgi:phosphoribosylamine--glycine ligase